MQLYVHRDGRQFGPYSIEQARAYVASGNLVANDLAWHQGGSGWIPLRQVPGISPESTPARSALPDWVPQRRSDEPQPVATVSNYAPAKTYAFSDTAPASANPSASAVAVNSTAPASTRIPRTMSYKGSRGSAGGTNMAIGALLVVVGLVITIGSYAAAASSPGGGHYIIAWGAVVFGAVRFFKGLSQSGR